MALTCQESFDRCCRLCAQEQEVTIMIFSAEAEAMLLPNKLNKYLLIEIDEDDRLPKNICLKCCSKLQTVCDFIDVARKSQDILMDQSLFLEQMTNQMSASMPVRVNTESNIELEDQPETYRYEGPTSMDDYYNFMEISVDPMVILQNLDASTSSIEDSNQAESDLENESVVQNEPEPQSDSEDVSYLHGLDGENVTIKLIKKNDHEPNPHEIVDTKLEKPDLKPFPCNVCKRSFLTELALRNHSWIHVTEDKNGKQFKCHSCGVGFDYRCDLIAHLKEHRSRSTCNVCGRIFRSEGNLTRHMAGHSSPFNNHTCKICGRSYNTLSNLKTHSITHSNERPFKCHLCKKCFKRNQDLKFHINQHTGAKPYKCPFCDKCFASSGNCYSHRSRMHPGRRLEPKAGRGRRRSAAPTRECVLPRPIAPKMPLITVKGIYKYHCTVCEHTFMKRDNFTYHMFQHTGKKPFECSYCKEKFVTRRGLLLHHDKKHPSMERPLALLSKNLLLK